MTGTEDTPELLTAERLQAIMEQAMVKLSAGLRAEFDKELLNYVKIFEVGADLRPDRPEAPGLRAAAKILRKAMESDDAP